MKNNCMLCLTHYMQQQPQKQPALTELFVLTIIMCTNDDNPPWLDGSEEHIDVRNVENKNNIGIFLFVIAK